MKRHGSRAVTALLNRFPSINKAFSLIRSIQSSLPTLSFIMSFDNENFNLFEIRQALHRLGRQYHFDCPDPGTNIPPPEEPSYLVNVPEDPTDNWEYDNWEAAVKKKSQSLVEKRDWDTSKPKVKVLFGDFKRYTGDSNDRSAVICRYFVDKIRENPQVGFLDCLVSSTVNPRWFSVVKEFEGLKSNLDFPAYYDMRKRAREQHVYWLNLVREPHFETSFLVEGVDELTLRPLKENSSLLSIMESLAFDPPHYQVNRDYTIYPSKSVKAKELLAAFGFLDFNILEELIPRKNFVWACRTILFDDNHHAVAYMSAFLDYLPLLVKWQTAISKTPKFDSRPQAFAEMHCRIKRHYNKMRNIQETLSEFPYPEYLPTRALRKGYKGNLRKKMKCDRKATNYINKFRPILLAKLKFDEEDELLQKDQAFIAFSWQRFHELVTWSFPHCIVNANAVDDTPLEDPAAET